MTIEPLVFTFTTSLGELKCNPLTYGMWKDVLPNRLKKKIENTTSEHFVRVLISVVCHKVKPDNSAPPETKESPISLDDAFTLSDMDLERFSELFYEKNRTFFQSFTSRTEKIPDESGSRIVLEKGDVKLSRQDKESFVNYLHRLFIENEKDEEKHVSELRRNYGVDTVGKALRTALDQAKAISTVEKMRQSFAGINDALSKQIKAVTHLEELNKYAGINDAITNQFKESARLAKISNMPTAFETMPATGMAHDVMESIKKQRELQNKPLYDIAERMDTFIDLADRGEKVLKKINDSGNESHRLNRWILGFSVAAVFVALGFGLHSIFSRQQPPLVPVQSAKKETLDEDSRALLKQFISQQQLLIKDYEDIKKSLARSVPKEISPNKGSKPTNPVKK